MPDAADTGLMTPRARFWLRIVALLVGTAILLSSMILVFVDPVADTTQAWIIRAAVSLSGGLVVMGMLGFLQIGLTIANYTIKAGGPMAVVVLLYMTNPPDTLAESQRDDDSKQHLDFFENVDRTMTTRSRDDGPVLGEGEEWAKKRDEISRKVTGIKYDQLARSATPEQLEDLHAVFERKFPEILELDRRGP